MDFEVYRSNTIEINIIDSMEYQLDIIDIPETIIEILELLKII